ncbi:MAG: hypothetical protein IPI33_11985 [Dehalococcoidia bacterium]|nr:hypothetical protein [Dehalococcoidia bacterium]
MARIQSSDGVTPQGGVVQFYVDPPFDVDRGEFELQPNAVFGAPAPLFTTGSVSVAQLAVNTTGIEFGGSPTSPGMDHTFVAAYSGGINAFGSQSKQRVVRINRRSQTVAIQSMRTSKPGSPRSSIKHLWNMVDPSTGYSVSGGFAVPKESGRRNGGHVCCTGRRRGNAH